MAHVKNALIFSFLAKYSALLIQVGGAVVLARLLTPDDFGVFAISFVFVAIANVLKEAGVSQYLIKEKELTKEKIGSAFTILLFSSLTISCALFVLATPIADFYEEPRLVILIQFMSLNILLSPFGSIINTLLYREMNFKPNFIATIVSQAISYASMIYMAYSGWGAVTLAIGAVIGTLGSIFVLQFFRPNNSPVFPMRGKILEVVSYSKFVAGASLITQIGNYSSELAVGKYFSMESVGLLNRVTSTNELFNKLFNDALYPVIIPHVSRINHEGGDVKKNFFLVTNVQLNIALPFFAILALFSEDFLSIVFGEQWIQAALFLTIYCGYRILFSFTQHFSPIFMGLGLGKEVMKMALVTTVLNILIVLLSVQHGISIMLISLYIVPIVRTVFCVHLLSSSLGISAASFMHACMLPTLTTFATIIPLLLVYFYGGVFNFPLELTLAIFVSASIWLFCIMRQGAGELAKKIL